MSVTGCLIIVRCTVVPCVGGAGQIVQLLETTCEIPNKNDVEVNLEIKCKCTEALEHSIRCKKYQEKKTLPSELSPFLPLFGGFFSLVYVLTPSTRKLWKLFSNVQGLPSLINLLVKYSDLFRGNGKWLNKPKN